MTDTNPYAGGSTPSYVYTKKEEGYTTKGNAERTRRTDKKKTFSERNKTYFNNLAAEVLGDRPYDMSNYSDDELDKMIKKKPDSQEGILAQKERNRRNEEAGMATKEVNVTNAKGGKDDMRFSSGDTIDDAKTFGDTKAKDVPAKLREMGVDPSATSREEAAALVRTDNESNNNKSNGGSGAGVGVPPSSSDEPTTDPIPTGISTDEPTDDLSTKAVEESPKGPEDPEDPTDIRKFSKDLNRFVVQAYLNGQFGKKSDPNAIATMGYFILDKIGNALVNASQVARGLTPTAKSEWSKLLDKQTELMGKRVTAEWFNSLSPEEQAALLKTGSVSGTTATAINENVSDTANKAREMDMEKKTLEISKLSQEQKATAQSNLNELIARKTELQGMINKLQSDQGWDSYMQAMNAYVGTARGLNTIGATSSTGESSSKGWSDTLNANIGTGAVVNKFVDGGIGNNTSWNSSSAKTVANSSSLNKDAFAYSRYKDGESFARAGAKAQKEANQELIAKLQKQIDIIDSCISAWGKDLGISGK